MYGCAPCGCSTQRIQKGAPNTYGTGLTKGRMSVVTWLPKPNAVPLEEQPELLTTEASLQSLYPILIWAVAIQIQVLVFPD